MVVYISIVVYFFFKSTFAILWFMLEQEVAAKLLSALLDEWNDIPAYVEIL